MSGFVVDGPESFVSKLVAGGARASLFKCKFTPINGAENSQSGAVVKSEFICKGVQVPASAVGIVNIMYMGRSVKFPGVRTFDDITTTIINDEGYNMRNKIESWMDKINSHAGNVRSTDAINKLATAGYSIDMDIHTLGKAGNTIGKWRLHNAWPTSLDQIDVNWEPNDAIMEYSVTWSYDYWTQPV